MEEPTVMTGGGPASVIGHCDVGLAARQRRGFVDLMIEFAICDAAFEADDAHVTPALTTHPIALWAIAWRARSAAWMVRHRALLEAALTKLSR